MKRLAAESLADYDGLSLAAEQPAPPMSSNLASISSALKGGGASSSAVSGQVGYRDYMEGEHYPVGSRVLMPLDIVVPHPLNPRVYFEPEALRELEGSLRAIGQQEDAKVYFDAEIGKFVLKSGHRRHQGLGNINEKFIKTEIVERKEGLEFFREARDLNTQHKQQHHLDDAIRFPELMKSNGLNSKQFASKLGMSESEVSKRVKIGTLPRHILDEMAQDIAAFGIQACYYLSQIFERHGEERVKMLCPLVRQQRISVKRLMAITQEKPGSSPDEGKRQLPERRCELKGGAGVIKAFQSRIEFKVELDPGIRDKFFEKLEDFFIAEGLLQSASRSSRIVASKPEKAKAA